MKLILYLLKASWRLALLAEPDRRGQRRRDAGLVALISQALGSSVNFAQGDRAFHGALRADSYHQASLANDARLVDR